MSNNEKPEHRDQTDIPEVTAEVEGMIATLSEADRQTFVEETIGGFGVFTVRMIEVINFYIQEAHRHGDEPAWDLNLEQEIAELKSSNKSIRKLDRLLEELKKLQKHRLDGLLSLQDLFKPGCRKGRHSEWSDD